MDFVINRVLSGLPTIVLWGSAQRSNPLPFQVPLIFGRKGSQGVKKVSFTACHSGTSPQVISNSPKTLFVLQHWLQSFCNLNFPQKQHLPSDKLRTKITSTIAKSTSPGLSDTTFFARWVPLSCTVPFIEKCTLPHQLVNQSNSLPLIYVL